MAMKFGARLNHSEALNLGRHCTESYIGTYESLVQEGYPQVARAMVLSTFPYILALINPTNRAFAVADMLEIYKNIGDTVFEDGTDLYDFLIKQQEKPAE